MEIDEKIITDEFSKISKNFETKKFNKLSILDKEKLLLDLAKITANCLHSKINIDSILFVDEKEIGIGAASFSFHENLIRINKDIFKNEIDVVTLSFLMDYVTHETVHFCQKQNGIFLEHLSAPIPSPYRTSQPHEIDAYNTSEKILNEFTKYLDNEINAEINNLSDSRRFYANIDLLDLMERHYSKEPDDIQTQIQQMLPFYKNVNTIDKLNEEHKLDIKIKMLNQHIDAISMNDNGICGILSVDDVNGKNKLHFTIKDDICFINEIIKVRNKDNKFMPVSNQNKEILISNLNKIINIGNDIGFFNCNEYRVNPISIVDKKEVHDKFVEDIKNNNIKTSGIFKNVISEEQIEKTMLKDIDER